MICVVGAQAVNVIIRNNRMNFAEYINLQFIK